MSAKTGNHTPPGPPLTLRVGEIFNPYGLLYGIWIPDGLLSYQGLSAGAKLAYGSLGKFAGKNARCYPSQRKIAERLGCSDRQVRNYLTELVADGFIACVQRGLRRTNAYVFLWHRILVECLRSQKTGRNSVSDQERNSSSAPERKRGSFEENHRNEINCNETQQQLSNPRSVPAERGKRKNAKPDSPEEISSWQRPRASQAAAAQPRASSVDVIGQTLFEEFGDRLGHPDSEIAARILDAGGGAPVERVCLIIRKYAQALRDGKKPPPRSYGLLLEHVRRFFSAHPHGARARRASKDTQPTPRVPRESADGIEYV